MKRLTRHRGVSLLEALVAMAVMAIGAVAVVGLQATLRMNADVAKQRGVAVRLAQEVIEQWRGFSTLTATGGVTDWSDLVTSTTTLTPPDTNATFTRAVTVVSSGESDDSPRSKTVHVRVTWTDRADQAQSVELNTLISGVDPQLGGSLSLTLDKSPTGSPGGRNPAIPRTAVDQNDGTSRFTPPGTDTPTWVFDNITGLITKVCPPLSTCSVVKGMLLSGFVRFATGTTQPTAVDAETPTSPALSVAVSVDQLVPNLGLIDCFESYSSTFVSYYCLLLVTDASRKWSGEVQLSGIALASSISGADPNEYKVCRYTTVRNNESGVPNEQTPKRYVDVDKSLTDQNFLVIKAGQAGVAFSCPDDNTSTANVNSATWYHQPLPPP